MSIEKLSGLFQKTLNKITEVREKKLVPDCYKLADHGIFSVSGGNINITYICAIYDVTHCNHCALKIPIMEFAESYQNSELFKYLDSISSCIRNLFKFINCPEISINSHNGSIVHITKRVKNNTSIKDDYWYYVSNIGCLTLFKFLGKYGFEDKIMNDYVLHQSNVLTVIGLDFISTELFYKYSYGSNEQLTHTIVIDSF